MTGHRVGIIILGTKFYQIFALLKTSKVPLRKKMSEFEGGCFCQGVRYKYVLTEETKPLFNIFCHCYTCRKFSSTSMQHLLVIPKTGFTVTKGDDLLKEYNAPDNSIGMVNYCVPIYSLLLFY